MLDKIDFYIALLQATTVEKAAVAKKPVLTIFHCKCKEQGSLLS